MPNDGARTADGTALAGGGRSFRYLKLIDDPTHTANEDGTYNLSDEQARAILDLRLQRLTQLGVKDRHRSCKSWRQDQGLPRHSRLPRAHPRDHQGRAERGA
jgi:hypothetical protein